MITGVVSLWCKRFYRGGVGLLLKCVTAPVENLFFVKSDAGTYLK